MPTCHLNHVKPVVFYDGGCHLCSKEIAHYRRLKSADAIQWVDITAEPDLGGRYGLDYELAMARFHVLDRHGNWHSGAYGFVEMWRHLSGYRFVARLILLLRVLPLLDRAYAYFAKRRLINRCRDGTCQLTQNAD